MIEVINGTANSCPIIFIHGFLEDNSMWDFIVEDKSFANSMYFVELPGHGKSTFELSDSIAEMAKDIHDEILNLGLSDCQVVGHSMGGYVALELAKQFPEFYLKTILLNSLPLKDSDQKKIDRSRVVDIVEKNKSLFIRTAIPNLFLEQEKFRTEINLLIQQAEKMSVKAIQLSTIAMRNRDSLKLFFENNLESIHIIYGELDRLVPLKRLQEELNYPKNISVIDKGGHMCHLEKKNEVVSLFKEYFKE